MKKVALITLLLLVTVKCYCQCFEATNSEEKKVLHLINSLPEVVRENKFRKKAHCKTFLKAYIQNRPDQKSSYYKVSVSEDLGFQLRTYDWYEVAPKTWTIRYEDMVTGKTISLIEWRRQLARKHGVRNAAMR